jgi:hypothetical protein
LENKLKKEVPLISNQPGFTVQYILRILGPQMITEMLLWLQEVEQLVCLVPELCYLTGLTDNMRNDFHVMKDIAMYTRITPNQRQAALKKFIRNIQGMRKPLSGTFG